MIEASIGELCEIVKGETGIMKAIPGQYPLVVTGADRKSSSTFQFDDEAVCIPLVSSTGHGHKSLNYVHYQSGKFALGTILAAVIPKDKSVLSAEYLQRYLQFNKDRVLVPLMTGAANVTLSMKNIAKVSVPIPSIEKQHKYIDLINRIEKQQLNLNTEFNTQSSYLTQLRQAILQEAIEGKLTADWRKENPVRKGDSDYDAEALLDKIKAEKDKLVKEGKIKKQKPLAPIRPEEVPFELPEGWVWLIGEQLGEYIDPQPSHRTPSEVNSGIPYVSMKDIDSNGMINFHLARKVSEAILDEHKRRYTLNAGDFVVGKIGTIGNPVWTKLPQNYTLSANLVLVQPYQKIVLSKYMFWVLASPYCETHMTEVKSEMSYPVFGIKKMRQMPFPLPPFTEQKTIVDRVENILSKVDELENQVTERKEQSEQLMQAVLREAFEGNK